MQLLEYFSVSNQFLMMNAIKYKLPDSTQCNHRIGTSNKVIFYNTFLWFNLSLQIWWIKVSCQLEWRMKNTKKEIIMEDKINRNLFPPCNTNLKGKLFSMLFMGIIFSQTNLYWSLLGGPIIVDWRLCGLL